MLCRVARAGCHAAPFESHARHLRPLGLITTARYSHGSSLETGKPAPLAAHTGPFPKVGPARCVKSRSEAKPSAKHFDSSNQHQVSNVSDVAPTARNRKKISRGIEDKKTRRTAERKWHEARTGVGLEQWRNTMRLLMQNMPTRSDYDHPVTQIVKIPLRANRTYQHNPEEVLREISLKYNCHICLIHVSSTTSGGNLTSRYITIQGQAHLIILARRSLYSAYDTILPVSRDELESMTKSSASKQVILAHFLPRSAVDLTLADIQRPAIMTVTSFASHVHQLISSRPSRLTTKLSTDKDNRAHSEKVAKALVELFKTEAFRSSWSLYATLTALKYLGRHEILRAQRIVFQELEKENAITSPDIWTVMLQPATRRQDLKNFRYILGRMFAHGWKSSWQTWRLFIQLVVDYDAEFADFALHNMRRANLLEPSTVRISMAETMCGTHYSKWMDSGLTMAAFLEHYDRFWGGAPWFTPSSLLGILTHHVYRGQFERVQEILELYKQRGGTFTTSHLEVVISGARRFGHVKSAVFAINFMLNTKHAPVLTREIYDMLFGTAMQRRYFNMACVVWLHAFARGHISRDMLALVSDCFVEAKRQDRGGIQQLDRDEKNPDDTLPAPGDDSTPEGVTRQTHIADESPSLKQAFSSAIGSTIVQITAAAVMKHRSTSPAVRAHFPKPIDFKEPLGSQQRLLDRLLRTPQRFAPTKPLHKVLYEAYRRDMLMRPKRYMPSLDEVVKIDMTCVRKKSPERYRRDSDGVKTRPTDDSSFLMDDSPMWLPSYDVAEEEAVSSGFEQTLMGVEENLDELWALEADEAPETNPGEGENREGMHKMPEETTSTEKEGESSIEHA